MARQSGKKSRSWAFGGELLGYKYELVTGNATPAYARFYSSSETILSSNHPGPPYRSGGPMLLYRTVLTNKNSQLYVGDKTGNKPKGSYTGKFQTGYVPTSVPLRAINGSLDAIGTEAISRTIPTSPSAGLSVFIGELRDFPGMIKQTSEFFARLSSSGIKLYRGGPKTIGDAVGHFTDPAKSAGDYLNLQFGWLPFIRDLVSFYKTGRDLDKRIAQLKRNNMGKPVTRGRLMRQWDDTVVAESTIYNSLAATLTPAVNSGLYWTGTGCSSRTRTVRQSGRVWFKGTYRYYSPEIASAPDWVIASDILGMRLDPAVIYQLTPWSWLIDWFTTTGSVVTNAVEMARHHVVLDHGYVMAHRRSVHEVKCTQKMKTFTGGGNYSVGTYDTTTACLFEDKQRVVANPYGFGLNWESLSGYQLSILAALGITRRRSDQ